MIYLGSTKIGQLGLGSTKFSKAYIGSTLVYTSALPYTLYYSLPNRVYSDTATLLDLRSAGLPSTGNYPCVAFYNRVRFNGTGANNEIVYRDSQSYPVWGMTYTGTTPYLYRFGSNYSLPSTVKHLKTIFFYDSSNSSWVAYFYYSTDGTTWTLKTSVSNAVPAPWNITELYTSGASTSGLLEFNSVTAMGFENLADAQAWDGTGCTPPVIEAKYLKFTTPGQTGFGIQVGSLVPNAVAGTVYNGSTSTALSASDLAKINGTNNDFDVDVGPNGYLELELASVTPTASTITWSTNQWYSSSANITVAAYDSSRALITTMYYQQSQASTYSLAIE